MDQPDKNNHLASIIGPTGIGKTATSVRLAQHFSSEILSADSRQFFKEMEIGTAVPSEEELTAVKHHFIHHKSIFEAYSVGTFEREAVQKITKLFEKHDLLFLVGGSGLYVNAVNKGLDNFPEVHPSVRFQLNKTYHEKGLAPLQEELKKRDPVYSQKVDLLNPQRVIRALEICIASGNPYSDFLNQNSAQRNFKTLKIGLDAPRKLIYERIEQRVDKMMEAGLLEEAKTLYEHKNLNAMNTVGYKELFLYFGGELSLEKAVEEIKKNTRRFAKRQLTWFRKDPEIEWFEHDTPTAEIIGFIEQKTFPR